MPATPQNPWIALLRRTLLLGLAFIAADRLLAAWLITGLERYVGLDRPARVLCIGHSRTDLGIDRADLERRLGVPVAKFAMNGVDTFDRTVMIRFFLRRRPDVQLVLYDVEAATFSSAHLSANAYRLFLPFMDDPDIRAYIRRRGPTPPRFLFDTLVHTARFDDAAVNRALRGHLGIDENLKSGTLDLRRLRERIRRGDIRPPRIEPANYRAFLDLMDELAARGLHVILWQPPTVDELEAVEPDARRRVRDIFRKLAAENDHVDYLDYVDDYKTRHDLFYDGIHLNRKGRAVITRRLAEDIRRLGLLHEQNDAAP